MLWLIQRQLNSKNVASRRKAMERLCLAPQPRDLDTLGQALKNKDAEVRRLAAAALGKLEVKGRIKPLLGALLDRDPSVQMAAILALKRSTDERVPPALVPLLHDANAGVRGCAAQVLAFLGWRPANREDEMWLLAAKGKWSQVALFGAPALLPLEMALKSGPYSLCVAAAKALGDMEDPRAVRLLIEAVKSNDPAVCAAAVDALAKVGGTQATEPILGLLQHTHSYVRLAAAEALGHLGSAAATEPLRTLLHDPQWDVRRAAVEALAQLRDDQAVEALTRTLEDNDADVREAAAIALGSLGDRRGIGPLVLALRDTASGVRRIAAAALSRIDENWSTAPEARAAAEKLKASLHDRDPEVRYFVGQLLVSLGLLDPEASPELSVAEAPGSGAGKRRKLAVTLFLTILGDTDSDLRQAAAEALGRLGERRAEPGLVRALEDPDDNVRAAAGRALQALATPEAASALRTVP